MAVKRDLGKTKAAKLVVPKPEAAPATNPLGAPPLPEVVEAEPVAPPESQVGTAGLQPGMRRVPMGKKQAKTLAVLRYDGDNAARALAGVPTRSRYSLDPYAKTVTVYIQDLEYLLRNPSFRQIS